MNNQFNKKSIQDKLSNIKYNCDSTSHLILDNDKCKMCEHKVCTFICPADVYEFDKTANQVNVQYENCMECGACRIACNKDAISWAYPKAGFGVIFKNS